MPAEPQDISTPAFFKHLRVLEWAGLMERREEVRWRPARLEVTPEGSAEGVDSDDGE